MLRFMLEIVKKFGRIFQNYLRNSSVHGYHYLADPGLHWTERIFWLFSIVLSSLIGVYMMIQSTNEATEQPISLAANTLYLDWETNFPAVVFCESYSKLDPEEYVPYLGRKMEDFPDEDLLYISELVSQIVFFYDRFGRKVEGCKDPIQNKRYCILETNFSKAAADLRLPCEQLLIKCVYDGREFDCCDRFHPMYTIAGKCFALNSIASDPPTEDRLKFRYQDSPILSVELKTADLKVYVLTAEDTVSYRETEYGHILGGVDSDREMENSELDVYFRIQEIHNDNRVKDVPMDIRKCRYPDESGLRYSQVYSYPACVLDSVAAQQMEICGCVLHFLPGALSYPEVCRNVSGLVCIADNFEMLMANGTAQLDCEISCTESEVDIQGMVQREQSFENGTACRINFVATPPTLKYERRVVRDYVYLIVNVGGIGTLFFGASVLSIVEIFYYFFVYPCTETKDVVTEKEVVSKAVTPIVKVLANSKYAEDELAIFRKGLFKRRPYPYAN